MGASGSKSIIWDLRQAPGDAPPLRPAAANAEARTTKLMAPGRVEYEWRPCRLLIWCYMTFGGAGFRASQPGSRPVSMQRLKNGLTKKKNEQFGLASSPLSESYLHIQGISFVSFEKLAHPPAHVRRGLTVLLLFACHRLLSGDTVGRARSLPNQRRVNRAATMT